MISILVFDFIFNFTFSYILIFFWKTGFQTPYFSTKLFWDFIIKLSSYFYFFFIWNFIYRVILKEFILECIQLL